MVAPLLFIVITVFVVVVVVVIVVIHNVYCFSDYDLLSSIRNEFPSCRTEF